MAARLSRCGDRPVLAGAELQHVLSFDKKADFGAEGTVLYGLVLSLLVALIYLMGTWQATAAHLPGF